MKKTILITLIFLKIGIHLMAQDSTMIESRRWYRDSVRAIHFADWQSFSVQTVDLLRGYKPTQKQARSVYGGDKKHTFKATGFFRTEKEKERWWIVDPSGCAFITNAINSVRQGKSPNNEKAFAAKYKTPADWMDALEGIISDNHFNGAGSWSELEHIVPYNAAHPTEPIVYTTQLSFIANFAQKKKRKMVDPLAWVFDPTFPTFCDEHAQKNAAQYRNVPNLLGHFSDNELHFTTKKIDEIWATTQEGDEAHRVIVDFLKEKKAAQLNDLTESDREDFAARIAATYYKTVSAALKKHDPNHLYIGSRLHESAKFNKRIFTEGVEKYLDMVSINYYSYWQPQAKHLEDWSIWTSKPFFITEFYTKGDDVGMKNTSGAGWLVRTQKDRGLHYQNFCLQLLKNKHCVGWHWFRYQDNDPKDTSADPSNQDSNKGLVNTEYVVYKDLMEKMRQLNVNKYKLINFFDKRK